MIGDEIARVTARKDQFGEVKEFICNECRFEKKNPSDWNIEGPRQIDRSSVISANHYEVEAPQHTPLLNKA
jgi:NADH-quinone oxidoreductase subunit G